MSDYMLRMLRRDDRRRMVDRVDVTRGSWPSVTTVAESVRCVIRPSQRAVDEVGDGGRQVRMFMYDVRLPVDVDVQAGDVLTVTSSRDALLVGRWLTVREVVADSEQTSRILVCEEGRG